MSKRYLVTHVPHYIGQRLVQPGETVTLPDGVEPGRWLLEAGAAQEAKSAAKYRARHNGPGVGAGNWVVENIDDGSHASVVFNKVDGDAKAKAEAEADRLNAGGEISLGGTDTALSSAQADPLAGAQGDDLPDA